MSISPVVTRGYGSFGTVNLVVTRGYSAGAAIVSATLSGTILGSTEADIVAGGKTIILTLTNDTWVASGAAFNAIRQDILDGLDSSGAELTGWNALVRDAEVVTAVVRTSDTAVTVTLSAAPLYDITAQETITATVPSSALTTSLVDVTASPTFDISVVVPVDDSAPHGAKDDERRRYTYKPLGLPARPRAKVAPGTKADRERIARGLPKAGGTAPPSSNRETEASLEKIREEIQSLTPQEVDAQIGALLRQKLEEENQIRILMLMSGAVH